MKKVGLFIVILFSIVSFVYSSPTIYGSKGVLRVFAADPEIFTAGKPTMFFGFYQGYARAEDPERKELHYGFNITVTNPLFFAQRLEFSYLIENLQSDFPLREKPLSNDFKLKLILLKTPFLKIAPIGEFGFPITEGGGINYGGYLTSTIDLGAAKTFLPLKLHLNSGYLIEGENTRIPVSGALVYPLKYFDIFLETGINDIDYTSALTITPGVKLKLWGIRVTMGYDFNTEGEPENKFNFMFSWLGPLSGIRTVPEIGIGKIKGFVYDTKTDEPVMADILLEGDINRTAKSNSEGNFSIDELPPGEYTAIANADGYEGKMIDAEVHRGETKKLMIGLKPIAKIGILSGSVLDAETNDPLNAELNILPIGISIPSDSFSGEFSTELEENKYNVTVSKEGYYTVEDTFSIFSDSTTTRIYKLKQIEKIGTFKGKIVDAETEKPLGALITFKEKSLTSDSLSGEFSIELEENKYNVTVSKEGYYTVEDTFSIFSDSTTTRIYKLKQIEKIGTFKGKIVDAETEKPLGALITFKEKSLTSDSLSGEFSTELEEGKYDVTVSKEGYYTEKDTVSIFSDSITERIYRLREIEKIGTFKGKIVDAETEKPLGALITFKEKSLTSDSLSGEFNIKLEEGSYTVGITKDRYLPLGDTFFIKADSVTERLYKLIKIKVKVITFMDVIFDFDKYFIKKKYYSELDSLADYLKGSENKIIITLSGHACSIGPTAYNLQLSKKRVFSVKNYLIKKGISEKRLKVDYFGELKPKHNNETEEGRIKNRRVEIIQEENGK